MKIKHLLLAAIATIATFAACQEKPEDLGEPDITLGTTELMFDQNAGSQTITLNSTRAWKVKDVAEWVVIEPSSGEASKDAQTVTVTVLANTGSNRNCSITFTCGIVSDYLAIKQDGPGGGPVEGEGTKESPYSSTQANLLGAELADGEEMKDVFVSGKVSTIKSIDTSFGNAEYYISDDGLPTDEFYIYRGNSLGGNKFQSQDEIKVGDDVVVYGTIINFKCNTVEMTTGSKIVKLNGEEFEGGGDGGGNVDPITGDNLLTNGSFEDWTGDKPAAWNHSSGNATLNKITEGAKEGSNACEVCGADQNKRLMSKSYTLKAGTYQIQAYIKGEGKYRAGYAKLTNGSVGDSSNYIYLDNGAAQANSDWTQLVMQFTFAADTEVALIFMNHSSGGGKSIIVDDVKLVTSDGGIVEGSGDDGGDTPGPGTFETSADKPASASAALAYAKTLDENTQVDAYVKGIISQIDEVNTSYGNATYYISDDGSTTGQFEIYRGAYLDGEKFTSADQIKVGDEVIVFGKIVNYKGTTPEMTTGSKIISINGQGGQGGGDDGGQGGDDGGGNIDPSTLTQITCAAFNALGADDENYYILEGKVVSLTNTQYGNLYIQDDSGEQAYIYGVNGANGEEFSTLGIEKNDIIKIYGQHTIYVDKNNVSTIEMKEAKLLKLTKGEGDKVEAAVTLTFPDDNSANNGVGSYTADWTAKTGDYSFAIFGFNNNKWGNDWTYIKCGRKSDDSTASIATEQAIADPVSSLIVSFDAMDASHVTSLKLLVARDAAFSNVVETINVTPANGDVKVEIGSPAANLYYKLAFECTAGGKNGFVQISKLVFAK